MFCVEDVQELVEIFSGFNLTADTEVLWKISEIVEGCENSTH
jgi:hypothetical protein